MPIALPRTFRITNQDAGIFLVSAALLLLELLLTRIYSVTMYYHLAFMVVSVAMMGLGTSGVWITVRPDRFPPERDARQLPLACLTFAISSVVAVGVAFRVPISLEATPADWLRLGLVYALCVVPFFAGGLVIALLLSRHLATAHRLYFFDLAGAAAGCLLFVPTTNILGAPSAVFGAAALAALAGAVLAGNSDHTRRTKILGLAAVLTLAALANPRWHFYDIVVSKGAREGPLLAVKWNSFSRVQVAGTVRDLWMPRAPSSWGFSTLLDPAFRIPEVQLAYDAGASTQITRFDGHLSSLRHLAFDVASAPYHLRRHDDVLVLGAGGGRDILTALSMGSRRITGVEVNPLTLELMRGPFRDFTGGLYTGYPGVTVIQDEGRTFIHRSPSRYDLIQISLVDTWAASAAGAYALSENALYTVEALEDDLAHLSPRGVLSFTRWFARPPVEALRLVTLAREAGRRQGIEDMRSHLFAVQTDERRTHVASMGTLLVQRSPFTREELAALSDWAAAMGFLVSYSPASEAEATNDADFVRLVGPRADEAIARSAYDLSPVHDDRPFFFDRVPLIPWLVASVLGGRHSAPRAALTLGGETLLVALVLTATCMLACLLLPRLASASGKQPTGSAGRRRRRGPLRRRMLWATYFMTLGLGFIMIEIVLIGRFSLFLGYPAYSLSVVLFTLLLAGGAGSLLAGRVQPPLPTALLALCAAVALYALVLPNLLAAGLAFSMGVRIVIAALSVAPLGLLMGMPFPLALSRAGAESTDLAPWGWAANGGASVFGSPLAILLSMSYGLTVTLAIGAIVYAIALLIARTLVLAPPIPLIDRPPIAARSR